MGPVDADGKEEDLVGKEIEDGQARVVRRQCDVLGSPDCRDDTVDLGGRFICEPGVRQGDDLHGDVVGLVRSGPGHSTGGFGRGSEREPLTPAPIRVATARRRAREGGA